MALPHSSPFQENNRVRLWGCLHSTRQGCLEQPVEAPAPPGPCDRTGRTSRCPHPMLKFSLPVEKQTQRTRITCGASSHASALNSPASLWPSCPLQELQGPDQSAKGHPKEEGDKVSRRHFCRAAGHSLGQPASWKTGDCS